MNDNPGPDSHAQDGPDQERHDQDGHDQDGHDQDPGAAGVEHLQRAAREMVAAARSFLDAIEKVVDDRDALREVSATVTGLAATVGETFNEAVRGRPAPWAEAAWTESDHEAAADDTVGAAGVRADDGADGDASSERPSTSEGPGAPDDVDGGSDGDLDGVDETEDWARPLVDPNAPRRASRVRRIAVE